MSDDEFDYSPLHEPNPAAINNLLDELEESLDDVGKIKSQFMPKILTDEDEFNSSQVPIDTISKRQVEELIDSIPKPRIQNPLQPGSTPNDGDDRFLCWNNTGIIRAQSGNDDQAIDVMFHDTEKHSSLNFKNEPNYTFGSLSEDLIVVGSNGKHNTGPSSIHGINLLETNRDQREWEIELPHVELIEGLAVGTGFVAVATDKRYLRFFTGGGMQHYIISLPGQILCLAAHERQVMIIYHNGAGHSDDQNLNMFTYHVDLQADIFRQVYRNIPVALGKRSPLAWAGFSDEGTPCTYDFNGVLRIYRQDLGNTWVPMLDLRELTTSALDHYFVVGVSEISQVVRAVKCRKSRYPEFSTETAELFSFSLPMCDLGSDQGKLEEEHIRLRLAESSYKRLSQIEGLRSLVRPASDSNEKQLVNTVLRLFAKFLKEGKDELARNLVYMIPKDHMSKLPEFAWKTKKPQYFIDSLNRAVEEREQFEQELKLSQEDDSLSLVSINSLQGKEIRRAVGESNNNDEEIDTSLKPIPLDKLMTNTRIPENNETLIDDESGDENDSKQAKRTKSVNYNIFSKNKRAKIN